ncbi:MULTISPECIES: LiaF transmembrane domain-containing protein [unclassified Marinitoga]|uniref:LiaF transmembrane domain-containing protein n=1 Tax=unclassified Marinitoga TaxID=2640159 RepID=UPI000658D7E3|nr:MULTISPECIES: hypothetical protein [unclassified Marinitoga]KLO24666.1 hypothetical protein X274_02605 [Marinitoga sp. 1155]
MRYVFGLFFVVIGIIFILQGFTVDILIKMGFNFLKFWPFLLIITGISILSKNIKWIKYINWIITLLFLLLLVFWNYNVDFFDYNNDINYANYEKFEFAILPDSEIITLRFDVLTVTLDISIDDNSDKIYGYYYGLKDLNIIQKRGKINFESDIFGSKGYKIYLKIPSKYIYKFYIDSGVANVNLNEEVNTIKYFQINSGVSRIEGEIGMFKEKVFFDIDSGVTKFNMILPGKTTYFLKYDAGIKKINISSDMIKDSEGDFQGNIDAGVLTINLKTNDFEKLEKEVK